MVVFPSRLVVATTFLLTLVRVSAVPLQLSNNLAIRDPSAAEFDLEYFDRRDEHDEFQDLLMREPEEKHLLYARFPLAKNFQVIWGKVKAVPAWTQRVTSAIGKNKKFTGDITEARVIRGDPHESKRKDGTVDPMHLDAEVYEGSKKLTTGHFYQDGSAKYSKKKYNE